MIDKKLSAAITPADLPDKHPLNEPAPSYCHAQRLQLLIQSFDQLLGQKFNTCLVGGASEPLYLPARQEHRAQIIFTRDYFSSALHELAHWCVAGDARRQQEDYGYWYKPDGRNAREQKQFELVEVKPQAIEWILSFACGVKFRPSADNLAQNLGASDNFKRAIFQQVQRYCRGYLGARPQCLAMGLAQVFKRANPLVGHHYLPQEIGFGDPLLSRKNDTP